MKYDVIVTAGGSGVRAGLGFNKVFYKLKNNKTVLENSCSLFLEDIDCENVIVVTNESLPFVDKKIKTVEGGKERKDSVYNGLLLTTAEYVLIHDGARPFLSKKELEDLKAEVIKTKAAILAIKATDTIKKVVDGKIVETIDRAPIYYAQTPQAFDRQLILKYTEKVIKDGIMVTDDASILELNNIPVSIVLGSKNNIKLTNNEDFKGI